MTGELHRPLQAGRTGSNPITVTVTAGPAELAALAARLRLPAIHSLSCEFALSLEGGVIMAKGMLKAEIEQICVVSLDAFRSEVHERFEVRFVPEERLKDAFDPDAPDEVGYLGDVIDLGEAAVEQLALALDPYPHKPGVEALTAEPDTATNPFAGLEQLKPGH